ncbi:phage portal protein [Hansschlegelia plantiphila]|uniref:Portal protein n=1 Tax=Hansschlegelia plantiphila TaxID=374655 RepID=A0A9W6IZL8_9HYPH|nr:phage portal protein [Hansschlegelia plantiphila]GLK68101.1 portal protein [Hansschlegelia plantiphila]
MAVVLRPGNLGGEGGHAGDCDGGGGVLGLRPAARADDRDAAAGRLPAPPGRRPDPRERPCANADQTACEFWEGVVACLCLWGNAYVEKSLSGGRLVALTLLRPDLMQVDRREDGSLRYRYSDPSGAIEYDEGELMHVRGFGVGGDLGLSVLAHARQTISSTIATDEAAARTFANGMRPGGFFTYEKGSLAPEQREQARKALIEPMQGVENAGRIGLLEAGGGFKWQEVVIPPADAELLASRRWHVEEVARWFGIPPILIGHASEGQTMWGSGVEQIMLGWLTLGLRPYLTRIEQAVKRSLIAPAERATLYAEFAVEGLLRADSAGRAEFASKMIQNAGMTPNEWRAKENMPPIEGGDQLFINSTLVPLAMAGQRPSRVQPAPGEPIPEDV